MRRPSANRAGSPRNFVDDQPTNQGALFGRQQPERAEKLSEDAPLVDVADQQDGAAGITRHRHVDDVGCPQVQLHGTARPFNDDQVILFAQPIERGRDDGPQGVLAFIVARRLHRLPRLAQHDDLRARVSLGFEQHRVHVGTRRYPRRLRLHRLGSANLGAVGADGGVVRHILGLERRHAQAAPCEYPAQGRGQRALADRRAGSHHHECFRRHVALPDLVPRLRGCDFLTAPWTLGTSKSTHLIVPASSGHRSM